MYVEMQMCHCLMLQGKLAGFGMEEQLPTVAIITHYDSFGAAPVMNIPL